MSKNDPVDSKAKVYNSDKPTTKPFIRIKYFYTYYITKEKIREHFENEEYRFRKVCDNHTALSLQYHTLIVYFAFNKYPWDIMKTATKLSKSKPEAKLEYAEERLKSQIDSLEDRLARSERQNMIGCFDAERHCLEWFNSELKMPTDWADMASLRKAFKSRDFLVDFYLAEAERFRRSVYIPCMTKLQKATLDCMNDQARWIR